MNFFAKYGFAIILMLSVILVGTLVFDAATPLVNEIHNALSPESSQPASPTTVM